MNETHPLIPPGTFCYRVVRLQPGEVPSTAVERYGKALREFSFHPGLKTVLCPFWRSTDHGTVRCEFLDLEVLNESEPYELALNRATDHFGAERVDLRDGKSIPFDEMRQYLLDRAAGGKARAPRARKLEGRAA